MKIRKPHFIQVKKTNASNDAQEKRTQGNYQGGVEGEELAAFGQYLFRTHPNFSIQNHTNQYIKAHKSDKKQVHGVYEFYRF